MSVLELVIAILIAMIVLAAALNWLISANRTVSISTAKAANNATAQNIVDELDTSLRFASGVWISQDRNTLYVENGTVADPPQTCMAWQFTGTTLVRKTANASSVVATGITPNPVGAFAAASSPYEGLASVSFTVAQSASSLDSAGTTVDATLAATNYSSVVGTGSCVLT